jgi:hypothetical protein
MPTLPDLTACRHDRLTIVSMAVIASALATLLHAVATLLHEGVGHGLTGFVRGDVPTDGAAFAARSCWPCASSQSSRWRSSG